MKKLISVILSLVLILSFYVIPVTAIDSKNTDDYSKSIINTYDENNLDTSILYDSKNVILLSENDNKYLQLQKYPKESETPYGIKLYDSENPDLGLFIPKKNCAYKITIKYNSSASSYFDLGFEIKGLVTGTNDFSGNCLGTIATVYKSVPTNGWVTASAYFTTGTDDYYALAVCPKAYIAETGYSFVYPLMDDISVTEVESYKSITNDYDDKGIVFVRNTETGNKIRRFNQTADYNSEGCIDYGKGSESLFSYGAMPAVDENQNTCIYFFGWTPLTDTNPYGVKIYSSFDENKILYAPLKNTTYKLSLRYKTTASLYVSFVLKIKGLQNATKGFIGDTLATVATIEKGEGENDEQWVSVEATFTTGSNSYYALAICPEVLDSSSIAWKPVCVDNISIQKCEEPQTYNTFDDDGVYYVQNSATGNKTKRFNVEKASFSNNINCIDNGLGKESLFVYGGAVESESKNNYVKMFGFTPTSSSDQYGFKIYNSFDDSCRLLEPQKNTVYKISFKYKTAGSEYVDLKLTVKGLSNKSDGFNGKELGSVLSVSKFTARDIWVNVEAYFTVDNSDYYALAICPQTTSTSTSWVSISIDDIKLEPTGTGSYFDNISGSKGHCTGYTPVVDGKLLNVSKGDNLLVSFNLKNNASAIGSKIAIRYVEDNIYPSEFRLVNNVTKIFTVNETNTESKLCETTVVAPVTGKILILAYNDNGPINSAGLIIDDLNVTTYKNPSTRADVNFDNIVDVRDLVHLKKHFANNANLSGECLIRADLDNNNSLNSGDLIVLKKMFLGLQGKTENQALTATYNFANQTRGSAEGTIVLTSTGNANNHYELFWSDNNKPINSYCYIGDIDVPALETRQFSIPDWCSISTGASQVLITDGISEKVVDLPASKLGGTVSGSKIPLVKDYTIDNNISNVAIVYPKNSDYDTLSIAREFRDEINIRLNTSVDFIPDTTGLDSNKYYILFGKTSLEESTTALNDIVSKRIKHDADYIIRQVNNKIVINADNNYSLKFAVEFFFKRYCSDSKSLITSGLNYLSSSHNMVKSISLADVPIENYKIVHAKTSSLVEMDAIDYLVSNVMKKTGKMLEVVNDTSTNSNYEILIGTTNRTDNTYMTNANASVNNEYTINVGNNITSVLSSSNSAVNAGVVDLVSRFKCGSLSTGVYNGVYDGLYTLTNGYRLTWSEEFNGTSLSSTWASQDVGSLDTMHGGYTHSDISNCTVENGALKAFIYRNGNDISNLSIATIGKNSVAYKYGYLEARIKLPLDYGYSGSLWQTTVVGMPGTGEFDVFENSGKLETIAPNLHIWKDGHVNLLQGLKGEKPKLVYSESLGYAYHNFGMQWDNNSISFYLDGKCYYSFDCTTDQAYDIFDRFAQINLLFSGDEAWTKAPVDDNSVSSSGYVDWVRVWQKDENGYGIRKK